MVGKSENNYGLCSTIVCISLVRRPGKILNFSDILFRYHILRQEYDALFHDDRTSFDQYMEIVNKRMHDVTNDTYMNAGKMN
jgi:hypothetical protein